MTEGAEKKAELALLMLVVLRQHLGHAALPCSETCRSSPGPLHKGYDA